MSLTPDSIPTLRRGVRRQVDTARGRVILMAPERVIVLDQIADAILLQCNGANVHEISSVLATRFAAPPVEVEADVLCFLEDLMDKGLIRA